MRACVLGAWCLVLHGGGVLWLCASLRVVAVSVSYTKRDLVSAEILQHVKDKIEGYDIVVSSISLVNFAFSPEYQKAIEAKVISAQQTAKAEQDLRRIEVEAKSRIAQAEGESSRFSKLRAEYSKAPDVTRKRLYIEAMETVLAETNTIMVDVKGSNNMLYLPLDKMIQHQSALQQPNAAPSTAEQPAQAAVEPSPPTVRTSTRGRDTRGR